MGFWGRAVLQREGTRRHCAAGLGPQKHPGTQRPAALCSPCLAPRCPPCCSVTAPPQQDGGESTVNQFLGWGKKHCILSLRITHWQQIVCVNGCTSNTVFFEHLGTAICHGFVTLLLLFYIITPWTKEKNYISQRTSWSEKEDTSRKSQDLALSLSGRGCGCPSKPRAFRFVQFQKTLSLSSILLMY